MAPESSIFLRVYKVLGSGFPTVAKRCFPNGFLGLLGGPLGACALPRGPPVRVLSSESLISRGREFPPRAVFGLSPEKFNFQRGGVLGIPVMDPQILWFALFL